jgi:TolB-like protein
MVRLFLAAVLAAAKAASAQSVAVLDVSLYNAGATLQEATDSAKAVVATEKLRDTLSRFRGVELIDSARMAAAVASPAAVEAAAGRPCNVVVACARAVGRALGVRWVVMSKVSKTSNLIWVLSGELIDSDTGKLLLDDEFELKGDPNTMVPAGVGLFATRIDKKIRGASSS